MMKQYIVLRFKRVKMKLKWLSYSNEYKMKLECGFKIQPSEEWIYKWYFSVKWVKIEVKMVHFYKRV